MMSSRPSTTVYKSWMWERWLCSLRTPSTTKASDTILRNRSPQSGPVPRDDPEDSIVEPDPEMLTEQRIALANWKKRSDVNYLRANLVLAANSYDPTIKAITSSAKVDVTFVEEEQLSQLRVKCMNKLAAWHLRVVSKPERSNRTVNRESSRLRKKHMDQQSLETALCWKMLPPPQPNAQRMPCRGAWPICWKWPFGALRVPWEVWLCLWSSLPGTNCPGGRHLLHTLGPTLCSLTSLGSLSTAFTCLALSSATGHEGLESIRPSEQAGLRSCKGKMRQGQGLMSSLETGWPLIPPGPIPIPTCLGRSQ